MSACCRAVEDGGHRIFGFRLRGYIGIMENRMETTIMLDMGIMDKNMATTIVYWGYSQPLSR